jgi:hypothetical protein
MRSFSIGSGDSQGFTTGNFAGVHLSANITHTTVNTPFAGSVFDWSKIQVKLILTRNRRDFEIFNDVALPLILASCYFSGTYDECKGGGTPTLRRILVAGAAAKEQLIIAAKINFPGVINLITGDQLRFEINSQTTAVNVANVDVSVSKLQWELIEGVGNVLSIPKIKVKTITAGQSSTDETFGDGVTRICFINNDKFTILTADQVITLATVSSDKKSSSDTYEEMLISRAEKLPQSSMADNRHQSFVLYDKDKEIAFQGMDSDDVRLHKVNVRLTMNPTNVNAGVNWIVVLGYVADTLTAQKGVQRLAKHQETNSNQYVG